MYTLILTIFYHMHHYYKHIPWNYWQYGIVFHITPIPLVQGLEIVNPMAAEQKIHEVQATCSL